MAISLEESPKAHSAKAAKFSGKAHPHFSGRHLSGTHSFPSIPLGQGFLASPHLAVREVDDGLWQDSLNLPLMFQALVRPV